MFVLFFAVTLLLVPCFARSNIETYHFVHVSADGTRVPQDIEHDKDKNTVHVTIGDTSQYKNIIPTINLHDFNTGYLVFKDIKHKICTLARSPIPVALPFVYKMGETNFTLKYTSVIDPKVLSYEEVRNIGGELLADFCKAYKTFKEELIPRDHKRDTIAKLDRSILDPVAAFPDTQSSDELGHWCLFCWGCIDGESYHDLSTK